MSYNIKYTLDDSNIESSCLRFNSFMTRVDTDKQHLMKVWFGKYNDTPAPHLNVREYPGKGWYSVIQHCAKQSHWFAQYEDYWHNGSIIKEPYMRMIIYWNGYFNATDKIESAAYDTPFGKSTDYVLPIGTEIEFVDGLLTVASEKMDIKIIFDATYLKL